MKGKNVDLEESEKITVFVAAIREGRKRGASQTLEEILKEDVDVESGGPEEEEELIPMTKLIKKGPTFT